MEHTIKANEIEALNLREIYVYPNGGCAEVALRILRDCLPYEMEITFIDDATSQNLQFYRNQILHHPKPLLLLGGDCYDTLAKNCQNFGLQATNGITLVAYKLSQKIHDLSLAGGGAYLFIG